MRIALIVAMANDGVLGANQGLPWRLSADLQYFKSVTMGKPIIMGRKTYESIGRPLPGRQNIVVTRNANYQAPGCLVATSLDTALTAAHPTAEVMVIGGAQLYKQCLDRAVRIYLTEVHADVSGDTFLEDFDRSKWKELSRERYAKDEKNEYDYSFVVLDRDN